MKRLLTITALTSVVATSAFAASQAEMSAISRYYPEANFETLTDDQVSEMFAISVSSESDADKAMLMENVVEASNPNPVTTDVDINAYVPEWRLVEMSDSERDRIIALVSRGEDPESTRVQIVESMQDVAPNLTTGEVEAVERIAPEADVTVLTTEQVYEVRAVLYDDDQNDANKKSRIDQILS